MYLGRIVLIIENYFRLGGDYVLLDSGACVVALATLKRLQPLFSASYRVASGLFACGRNLSLPSGLICIA